MSSIFATACGLSLTLLLAAAAAAGAIPPGYRLEPGTLIDVALETALSSETAKIGEPVRAKVERQVKEHGKVLLAKNSELLGDVTEASLASPGKMASFGVLFTSERTKPGAAAEAAFRAAIVRVYPVKPQGDDVPYAIANSPLFGNRMRPFPTIPGAEKKDPYAKFDHADGRPVAFAVMETFNGTGKDLGGLVMALTPGDIQLKAGANLQVRVLH